MPFFSFVLKERNIINIIENLHINNNYIFLNKKYYSKNTQLFRLLKQKHCKNKVEYLKFEKRIKIDKIGQKILFCLPPNIGLGDAVEYALFIQALTLSKKFLKVGAAFVGKYRIIFEKYFNLNLIFDDIIEEEIFSSFDTIFHFTLEINILKKHKYNRQDIEDALTKYFKIPKFRNNILPNQNKVKKITVFPISQSPIRTMTSQLLKEIIEKLYNTYKIEVIFDRTSNISNHIDKNISNDSIIKSYPKNLNELIDIIERVEFGIFVDSGPLHVAKINNIRGLLIVTSVGGRNLLNDFSSIEIIDNNYYSAFCKAPCGLTNIFNFDNKIGCYETLKLSKDKIITLERFNSLQRGQIKNSYINFIDNPVGCQKHINVHDILNKISMKLQ